MSKFVLPLAAAASLVFAAMPTQEASAQGIHLRVGGAQINIGNPHRDRGFYRGHRAHRAVVYSPYSRGIHSYSRVSHFGGLGYGISSRRSVGYRGHGPIWQDTRHIDRLPVEIVPPCDRYDYLPPRHRDRRWDRH